MKVHIVTEGNRIKMRISEKIVKYNQTPVEYSLSYNQRNDVDINFYICYNVFSNFGAKSRVKDIGYVTHIHNNSIKEHEKDLGRPFGVFNQLDGYLHMSSKTIPFFSSDNKYHSVVYGGSETEMFKPTLTLGIMQNGEVVGKGTEFLTSLANSMDLRNFKFIFCGIGWEKVVNVFQAKGVRFEYLTDTLYNDFPSIYDKIDYLFIPSLWEGGPMAVLEAMACQIPIISANTGWTSEITRGLFFTPGNVNECIDVLKQVEELKLKNHVNVDFFSYKSFTERLHGNFRSILNG